MSRIRSIHPGLFTDEAFVVLSPMARIFFMGLWTECDDWGSFEWSPLKLKMRLLPADSVDAAVLLAEIEAERGILRYEVNGKTYGAVRNFCQYQRPKKPNSVHPQTEEVRKWVNTDARQKRDGSEEVENQLPTGGGKPRQMEDGGDNREDEVSPPTPPAGGRKGKTIIPDDWEAPAVTDLPPQARACAEQWTPASYAAHAEAFHGHWRSARKMMADWRVTWANRIVTIHSKVMQDQKYGNAPPAASAKPKAPADPAVYERLKAKGWNGEAPPPPPPTHRERPQSGSIAQFIPDFRGNA